MSSPSPRPAGEPRALCVFQGRFRERIAGVAVLAPMHPAHDEHRSHHGFCGRQGNPGVSTGLMQHVIAKARGLDIRNLLFLNRVERQSELRTFLCKELRFVSDPTFSIRSLKTEERRLHARAAHDELGCGASINRVPSQMTNTKRNLDPESFCEGGIWDFFAPSLSPPLPLG